MAQSKSDQHCEMLDLAERAAHARAAGATAIADECDARYDELRRHMGGDDPASWPRTAEAGESAVSNRSPHFAFVPPTCSGSATTSSFDGTVGVIQDLATQEFDCVVSGIGPVLWNVDLFLDIDHTFAADLDMWLISPSGKTVTISTDNGGWSATAFGGTLFSDTVIGDTVTDHVYGTSTATSLSPEGRLLAFRGEIPNGTWKLRITDDLAGDSGLVLGWRLDVSTVLAAPSTSTASYSILPNIPVPDNATVVVSQPVSGVGSNLVRLTVRVDVTQTYSADLDMRLESPAGTLVTLSTDNGGGADNVFRGTLFTDAVTDTVTDHVYANLVTATPLSPEGALGSLYGQDPNGTWKLRVTDDLLGDTGVLERWDLNITTCAACSSSVVTYCSSSTSTNGCSPTMSASSCSASITAGPGSFVIHCTGVEGQKSGLIFYSISGRNNSPWATGSTSTLCVKTPTQRMRTANAGGVPGSCNGALHEDFFDYVLNFNSASLGNPPLVGRLYQAQTWFRDPPAPKTTNLSDALEFSLCP